MTINPRGFPNHNGTLARTRTRRYLHAGTPVYAHTHSHTRTHTHAHAHACSPSPPCPCPPATPSPLQNPPCTSVEPPQSISACSPAAPGSAWGTSSHRRRGRSGGERKNWMWPTDTMQRSFLQASFQFSREFFAPCKQQGLREQRGPAAVGGSWPPPSRGWQPPSLPPAACAAQSLPNSTSEQARVLAHGGDHGRHGSGEPGGPPLSGREFVACFCHRAA